MPPPSHTIEALGAVGRNVVNFQRLEMILKRLVATAPISGPLTKLESKLEKRRANNEFLTLKRAVGQWTQIASYTGPDEVPEEGSQPGNEAIVSFSVGFQWRPGKLEQLSAELESLAQERNDLIHQDLAQLNFEDEVACTELNIRLDAQNERIKVAIERLQRILTSLQDLARQMSSDEVLQTLMNWGSDSD